MFHKIIVNVKGEYIEAFNPKGENGTLLILSLRHNYLY